MLSEAAKTSPEQSVSVLQLASKQANTSNFLAQTFVRFSSDWIVSAFYLPKYPLHATCTTARPATFQSPIEASVYLHVLTNTNLESQAGLFEEAKSHLQGQLQDLQSLLVHDCAEYCRLNAMC